MKQIYEKSCEKISRNFNSIKVFAWKMSSWKILDDDSEHSETVRENFTVIVCFPAVIANIDFRALTEFAADTLWALVRGFPRD